MRFFVFVSINWTAKGPNESAIWCCADTQIAHLCFQKAGVFRTLAHTHKHTFTIYSNSADYIANICGHVKRTDVRSNAVSMAAAITHKSMCSILCTRTPQHTTFHILSGEILPHMTVSMFPSNTDAHTHTHKRRIRSGHSINTHLYIRTQARALTHSPLHIL